jgi:hypothetical protein
MLDPPAPTPVRFIDQPPTPRRSTSSYSSLPRGARRGKGKPGGSPGWRQRAHRRKRASGRMRLARLDGPAV